MKNIERVIWYDGNRVRELNSHDFGRAFKWILVEKEGIIMLLGMPKNTNIDFHKELRDKVCLDLKWDINELKVLGGGVNFDSEILHRSTYFGEMPLEYRTKCIELLRLN